MRAAAIKVITGRELDPSTLFQDLLFPRRQRINGTEFDERKPTVSPVEIVNAA
jgi:hypothetical protein